jgi:hypothetical protein
MTEKRERDYGHATPRSDPTRDLLEQARLALEACTGPEDCCGMAHVSAREWPLKLELLDRIQQHLDKTPRSENERTWIPISERLPEHRSRCLIADRWRNVRESRCEISPVDGEIAFDYSGVTHWMPLPEAPK